MLSGLSTLALRLPVFISLCVFEPTEVVTDLLENFLKFSEHSTKVVLHLDANQNYPLEEQKLLTSLGGGDRIHLNPKRIMMKRGRTHENLLAHLLNARHMSSLLADSNTATDGIFILQQSNMWWFRPCFEKHVRQTLCPELFYSNGPLFLEQGRDSFILGEDLRKSEYWRRSSTDIMEALTNNASFFTVSWKSEGLYFKISSMVALLEKLESFQAFEQRKLRDFAEEWVITSYHGAHHNRRQCKGYTQLACFQNGCGNRRLTMKECLLRMVEGRECTIFAVKRVHRPSEIELGYTGEGSGLRKIDVDGSSQFREAMLHLPSMNCSGFDPAATLAHFNGRYGCSNEYCMS